MTQRSQDEIRRMGERLSLNATPWDWLMKARALKRSHDLLFIRFEDDWAKYSEAFERDPSAELDMPDDSVFLMLLGFGIENFLKGISVSLLSNSHHQKTLKELNLFDHNLADRAKVVGASLDTRFSDDELDLLASLQEAIIWWGRYPSPTNSTKLISPDEGRLFSAPDIKYPEHFRVCQLFDRLEVLLDNRAPFVLKETGFGRIKRGLMPGDFSSDDTPV
jgi:hypothetical protein